MNITKLARYAIMIIAIPLLVIVGVVLLTDRQYALISLLIALLSCVPFFLSFEKGKDANTKKMIILAVLVTLSVVGRFFFAVIPFFKPVTAIIVLAAIYFGPEMGFLCGALSALLSNFYFGQGPWTPFQMFSWGIIGFIAGLLATKLKKNRILLALYGIFAGVLYSLVMDIWGVMWVDGILNWSRYLTALITALPVTFIYAVSNIVFLLFIIKPIGSKLERVKIKYNL